MSTMPMTPRQRSPLAIALESIIPGGQADPSTQALAPRSRGQMIAGILSDGVKGYLGQEGTFGATLAAEQQARRQAQAAEVKWQRDRVAGREDKQWEWQNKPKDPDQFERVLEASGVPRGSPAWTKAMGQRVGNLLNPMMPVATTDANGNPAYSWVPRNPPGGPPTSQAGAVSGPKEGAVKLLRQNPALKADFDAKYGPGMADKYLGGAGGDASGTFP